MLCDIETSPYVCAIKQRNMTAKAALAKALLDGRVLNIKNCVDLTGLTNCPREISRMIEQPFQVVVSRTRMEGKSRYGVPVTWTNYKLNFTEYNREGVAKLRDYVAENSNGGNDFVKKSKEKQSSQLTHQPLL